MRLLLIFRPLQYAPYMTVNKHTVQGFIYSLLKDAKFVWCHDSNRFKFFCFSDIFPLGDFKPGEEKHLLISSPDKAFIDAIENALRARQIFKLGGHEIKIARYKIVQLKLGDRFISASPIVLYEDNFQNLYYSFERNSDLSFFLQRLKENAVKKYNAFYSEDYTLNENIFDRLIFRKETAVQIRKGDKEFIIIGSMWKLLEKFNIYKKKKFYEFIMDCGLGEKNSLGFGFINPLK